MSIYIFLLILILFFYFLENSSYAKKNIDNNKIVLFIFSIIFIICSLRNSSVGRDIPGYKIIYELTKDVEFNNFNYVYFENGYLFLSKVCILLGLNFQWFIAICYLIILLPLYIFINKYSKDKIFSIIIFVCYMYFEFDLTGLRQAMSMSISIWGFMILIGERRYKILYFILIILIASLFHKGAYICYIVLLLLYIKNIVYFSISLFAVSVISLSIRKYLFVHIKTFFGKQSFSTDANLYIGLNIIFLIIVGISFLIIQIQEDKIEDIQPNKITNIYLLKLYLTSISIALFFGQETSARSFMYLNQSFFVLLPNYINKFSKKNQLFISSLFISFFLCIFINALLANSFDIIPYKFYWQK